MNFFISNFQVWLLVFLRITGIFVVAPFLSSFLIPFRAKVIIAIFLSFIVYPVLTKFNPQISESLINYAFMCVGQLLIGILMGFIVSVIFTSFQLAAQFYNFQMGFGINQVFDPMSMVQIPILGQFKYLIAILVFVAINGHHLLIRAVCDSFRIVPILDFTDSETMQNLIMHLSKTFMGMFKLSLVIAFPLLATMFLISLTMGLLAKASPQINILMVGFPLQITIGLFALFVVMPFIIGVIEKVTHYVAVDLIKFLLAVK